MRSAVLSSVVWRGFSRPKRNDGLKRFIRRFALRKGAAIASRRRSFGRKSVTGSNRFFDQITVAPSVCSRWARIWQVVNARFPSITGGSFPS